MMYVRLLTRSALPLLPLIAACGGDKPVGPGDPAPASGTILVVITTRGPDPDPDGYTLKVGTDVEFRVAVNDTVRITDPGVAEIPISLVAVSTNCSVVPSELQVASVEAERVSRLDFDVTCPFSASLRLIVQPGGSFLRPLEYVGHLEDAGGSGAPVVRRFTDSVTIKTGAGTKIVTLKGLSNNCQVQGPNPRTIEVLRDVHSAETFVVQCQGQLRDQILFAGIRQAGDPWQVWASNAVDGEGLIRVGPGGNPALSSDGTMLASGVIYGAASVIYVTDLSTGARHDIRTPGLSNFPDWSPDGSRIVFTMDEDIHVMNADGSGLVQLTSHPGLDVSPAWSPDGSKIAFQSHRDGPAENGEIYVMNADGSQLVRLTDNLVWDGEPRWSPDGSHIVFSSDRDPTTSRCIFVMREDGSAPTKVTSTPSALEDHPSWSPNGARIAYRAGVTGIRTAKPDGSSIRDVGPRSPFDSGPWQPSWSGP